MRKGIVGVLLAAGLVTVGAFAVRALAPPEVSVVLNQVSARTVWGGEPDVVALDFTVDARAEDVLDVLFVKQDGTAQWERDLTAAELWADAGPAGFQGIGVDRKLAAGSWLGSENGWSFSKINEPLRAAAQRFFVTVDVYQQPTNSVTIQLVLSAHRDGARSMQYDTGDRGIFVRTARPTPAATLAGTALIISRLGADTLAPQVRITEPAAGASFDRDWLVVRGVAQDVGGSAVAKVQLSVNRAGKTATWVEAVPEVTGFATWEARLFGLPRGSTIELRVRGEDWNGNRSVLSDPVTVTLTE